MARRHAAGRGAVLARCAKVRAPRLQERSAAIVDKILNGASPAKLPVDFPTQFVLLINAGTAKALGLAVPDCLRLRATEVVGEV